MAEESAKLRIPYIAASQAQKHVTHNEAMTLLDTLVQLSVLDKDLTAPPGEPEEGDAYIVAGAGGSATGAWEGWENRIARYIDGTWRSYLPGAGAGAGWRAWVIDENTFYVFDGADWLPFAGGGGGGFTPDGFFFVNKNGTNQTSIASQTDTVLTWATEVADDDGLFDLGNNEVTLSAGLWLITGVVTYVASGGNIVDQVAYLARLYKDSGGGYALERNVGHIISSGTGANHPVPFTTFVLANGTDKYKLYAWGGGAGDKIVNGNTSATYWMGLRIAP